MKKYTIEGKKISNLEDFYDQIESAFKVDKNAWGRNLDSLSSVLMGSYGDNDYEEPFELDWKDMDQSKKALGYKETIKILKKQVKSCHFSNRKAILNDLEKAKKNSGPTVFDWVKEIIDGVEHVSFMKV